MGTLTRQHWIEAGFNALEHEGHTGVSAENIARRLNVTRGSFYHHFHNKADYVRALLHQWEEDYTHHMLAYAAQGSSSAHTLLRYVEIAANKRPHVEVAIRAWALLDPEVASVQQRVDQIRLDFAITTSQRWVGSPSLANLVGQAAHLCLIGGQQTGLRHDTARFTGMIKHAITVLEHVLPPASLKR